VPIDIGIYREKNTAKNSRVGILSHAHVKLTLSASMALRRPGGGAPLVVATRFAGIRW